MLVNRKGLLSSLEAVQVGLSSGNSTEQANCFVFGGGFVSAFNDEVLARVPCDVGIEGAVQAEPLLALLRKMTEDELDMELKEGGLSVKGKRRRASIRMEESVTSAALEIEEPGKWRKIPEGLLDAIRNASDCCSTDESHLILTCVHVKPDGVESCDDFQIISQPMDTGLKSSVLIKSRAVDSVVASNPEKWGRTEGWLHFRNGSGLVISSRLYSEEYPDISVYCRVEGPEVEFPKDVDGMMDKAQIFSSKDPSGNHVTVNLLPGMLKVEGRGPDGYYEERRKIKYDGDAVAFRISPRMLTEIGRRSDRCRIGKGRIMVESKSFTYVACTMPADGE